MKYSISLKLKYVPTRTFHSTCSQFEKSKEIIDKLVKETQIKGQEHKTKAQVMHANPLSIQPIHKTRNETLLKHKPKKPK